MSKLPYRLLTIVCSIIVYVTTTSIRGGYFCFLGLSGFPLSILLGTLIYYTFTALLLNSTWGKQNRIFILIVVIAPFIPELIGRAFIFRETLISFPDTLLKILATIISWFLFGYTKGSLLRIGGSIVIFSTALWSSFYGFNYWINFVNHKSFSGRFDQHINNEIIVQDSHGRFENLDSLYQNYILLDFWSKRCGVCYKMMPEFEKLYERFKDSKDVKIYSIFCRNEDDRYNFGDSIVKSLGYSFPVVNIDYSENPALMKELGIESFPQFLIIDRDKNIVYHGNLSLAEKFLENL